MEIIVIILVVSMLAYFILGGSKRRGNIIMNEITKLIESGEKDIILKHIYYEAAKKFAVENGAQLSIYKNDPKDDSIITLQLTIDNKKYNVTFQRWMKGETRLTVLIQQEFKNNEERLQYIEDLISGKRSD